MASEQMQVFLDAFRDAPPKTNKPSFEQQRADMDAYMAGQVAPDDVLVDDYTLAGRPARKYFRSGVREDASILYLHGGGYCVGSLDSHHAFTAHLAVACATSVNALDYRLAPENPYPAALDDAIAAFLEMAKYLPADRIMIAGDSAGGGLALSCALTLKERGLPLPGCLALLSPATDLTASGESLSEFQQEYRDGALPYVGEHDATDAGISPLFGDMAGLPPLLVHVASDEAMLDDSTRLQARALEAGVVVELRRFDEAFHVFHIFTHLPESQDALAHIGEFCRKHIR